MVEIVYYVIAGYKPKMKTSLAYEDMLFSHFTKARLFLHVTKDYSQRCYSILHVL